MSTLQASTEPAGELTIEQALRKVLAFSCAMVKAAEAADFEGVTALMKEREHALNSAAALRGESLNGAEADLLRQIQEENARLLTALHTQRTLVARRLDGVRQERAIAAYRH